MRIVAVADTHLFHEELSVPPGDLFVHAGDMCRGGTLEELGRAAAWIRSLPHRWKIVIAGNHDWCFATRGDEARALLGPDVIYLQDSLVELDGVRIWGSPWQPEYNDWAFNLPRGAALREKWALIPDGVDLLVTHGPPLGYGDGSGANDSYGGGHRQGCEDLIQAVRRVRPCAHLFGHIHDSGGAWTVDATTFVNVTTWECERPPTVIELDVAARRVTPVVVPPARRA